MQKNRKRINKFRGKKGKKFPETIRSGQCRNPISAGVNALKAAYLLVIIKYSAAKVN